MKHKLKADAANVGSEPNSTGGEMLAISFLDCRQVRADKQYEDTGVSGFTVSQLDRPCYECGASETAGFRFRLVPICRCCRTEREIEITRNRFERRHGRGARI